MEQFDKIIEKYGPAFMQNIAGPVWEAAVRQVVISGVAAALWAVAFIIAAVVSYKVGRDFLTRRAALLERDHQGRGEYPGLRLSSADTDMATVASAVFIAGVPIFVSLALVALDTALHYALNPAWYAIKELGRLIK